MTVDSETTSLLLKHLREHNNLTQKEAAEKVGVSLQSWRSWEQGWRNISDLKLMAIIHILEPHNGESVEHWKEKFAAPEKNRQSHPKSYETD